MVTARFGTWRKVALHMKPGCGPTIEGLLVKRTRSRFVLMNAEILESVERTHRVGSFEVLRENVYGLQELE